jgi:hypothetical protein
MKVIVPVEIPPVFGAFTRASTATWFDSNKTLTTALVDGIRGNWNPENSVYEGVIIEPSRTNYIYPSAMPTAQQTISVTPYAPYVLSFYGIGTITMDMGYGGSLPGVNAYPGKRVSLFVVPTGTQIRFTFTGSPRCVQFEEGYFATSYMPTTSGTFTRAADMVTVGQYYTTFTDATATYSAGTTYAKGALVQYASRKYSSVAAGNIGNTPDATPASWTDIGATNVWAMHDRISGGQSTGSGYRVFAFRAPSAVDAVALINIEATNVVVVVADGHGRVNSQTKYGAALTAVAFTGFAAGEYVTVSMYNNGADVKIGECIAGVLVTIGDTQYPLDVSLIDFSKKETDPTFGTTSFLERAFSSRIDASVSVSKAAHGASSATLTRLRATPTAYIFSDDTLYGSDVIHYAFIRSMRRSISYPTYSLFDVELESLV